MKTFKRTFLISFLSFIIKDIKKIANYGTLNYFNYFTRAPFTPLEYISADQLGNNCHMTALLNTFSFDKNRQARFEYSNINRHRI